MTEKQVVFLYPSQGSQEVGMGLEFYGRYTQAREIFDQADAFLGFPLSRLCFEGPEEGLNSDLNAQLAVYTMSCAITEVLRACGVHPGAVSGYSSGFYAAAFGAGCFDFEAGLLIVRRAGEIILDEGEKIEGGMAVIFGLSREKVEQLCLGVGDVQVSIANTPRQIIVSGLISSVDKVMELAMEQEALDAYVLPVATAYHSRLLSPCTARLLSEIKANAIRDPRIPILSYATLEAVPDGETLKKVMAHQLSHPVWWVDVVRKLKNGNRLFLEVGPGAMLSRTVRWIDRHIKMMNTGTVDAFLKAIEHMKRSG